MNRGVPYIQEIIARCIPEGILVPEHDEFGHHYRHTGNGILYDSVTTKSSGILETPHLKKWAARLAVDNYAASCNIPGIDLEKLKEESILIHQDQFEDAGGIGTEGHGVIDEYLEDWMKVGARPEKPITEYIKRDDSRLFAIARSAGLFFTEWSFIPIASELLVVSIKHRFAGTLDCLGLVVIPTKKCTQPRHEWMKASMKNPYAVVCRHCNHVDLYRFSLIDWKTSNQINKPEYAMQVSAYRSAFTEMTKLLPRNILIVRLDKKQAKYEVMRIKEPGAAFRAFRNVASVYEWMQSDKKLEAIIPKEVIKI